MADSPIELVFLGATSFREIAEIARDINRIKSTYLIRAILDDDRQLHGKSFEGTPVVGPLAAHERFPDARFVMGIGSYKTRLLRHSIIERLGMGDDRYETLISPGAKIFPTAQIGPGCIVHYGAIISADTVMEPFAQVLSNSLVGADNRLCRGSLLASLVSTAADVTVGHYAHLGASSAVAGGLTIDRRGASRTRLRGAARRAAGSVRIGQPGPSDPHRRGRR